MPTQKPLKQRTITLVLTTLFAVSGSFALGLQTTGDIETIAPTEASGTLPRLGDMNQDGQVDAADVLIVLDIATGRRTATPDELLTDPDGDGRLTVEDARLLLQTFVRPT